MSESEQKPKSIPETEKEILEFWQKNKIFEKSLAKTKRGKHFVFFEGPPYANGRPGIHHVLARAYKDIILRFKTMRGFYVRRKAGWDTHGLPTEMDAEKKLGVSSKKEIEEKIGIERFVEEAKEIVFGYKEEWERLTRQMGYWLDLEHPYVTYTKDYIESLWWVFLQIAKNGYLYKDYKVLPWCSRCGTSLSSHELAQGYKKVKENSIYVKFPIKQNAGQRPGSRSYFLVWTTTPWTLPGNVALAVNPKARYLTVEKDGDWLILARDQAEILGGNYKEINEEKGENLIGLEYEPLYESETLNTKSLPAQILKENLDGRTNSKTQIYKVVSADFVSTTDGTGIVHVAPAFGAEDQKVGKENNLPTIITVDETGKMKTSDYIWDGKYFLQANPLIVADLKKRRLLFKEEPDEHDYPFCWRCNEPLMYYARDSWFFKTTAVKNRMLKENSKIMWFPEFIRDGRFGEWLKENVDWAISRERYWGMPIPIWRCQTGKSQSQNPKSQTNSKFKIQNSKQGNTGCGNEIVIGSLDELDKFGPKGTTRVFVMRHGEADHNVKGIVGPATPTHDHNNHLTKRGIGQVENLAKKLKKEKIDLIISSPLIRAKETAGILGDILGVEVKINENIYDYNLGEFQGRKMQNIHEEFPFERKLREPFPNGESLRDVRARMMEELRRIVKKHSGKKILIVSHGDPLWVLNAALGGVTEENYVSSWYPKTAEVKELKLHNWPYNRAGEADLHRPYIDLISLSCPKCKKEMTRVKEVADVWYDSGCMPFAQDHYPFENKLKLQYPADYIAEGLDQTRGWFYTLLAVASLLRKPTPYKNVLVLGLVLDEKGEKMSKSRGNAVEPFQLFEKYGADAVRWYFYTINHPWDEKLFKESDIAGASRKFLNIFWNSFLYWKTYRTSRTSDVREVRTSDVREVINKWLLYRLNQVGYEATEALEKFDVVRAARAIENFVVEDISHWYIRRIRDLIRFGKKTEQKEISTIFGHVLFMIAKILAPLTPFVSERIYQEFGGSESVHLNEWPKFKKPPKSDIKLIKEMNEARNIVSQALEARARAGIKVRQPITSLKIKNQKSKIKIKELLGLIKGEVNVKEIKFDQKIKDEVELDTVITPELKEEGQLRELIRHIQGRRKEAGLKPSDKITFVALTDERGKKFVKKFEKEFKKEAGIKAISFQSDRLVPLKAARARSEKPLTGLTISLKFDIS